MPVVMVLSSPAMSVTLFAASANRVEWVLPMRMAPSAVPAWRVLLVPRSEITVAPDVDAVAEMPEPLMIWMVPPQGVRMVSALLVVLMRIWPFVESFSRRAWASCPLRPSAKSKAPVCRMTLPWSYSLLTLADVLSARMPTCASVFRSAARNVADPAPGCQTRKVA